MMVSRPAKPGGVLRLGWHFEYLNILEEPYSIENDFTVIVKEIL